MAKVDSILHPLASLEWKTCQKLPVGMRNPTAVWHVNKLYVGAGSTAGSYRDDAKLYIYTPTTDVWNTPIDTPVYFFGLTTYRSQLVLVGGRECESKSRNNITDKLWILSEHDQWEDNLPSMKTKRHSVCAASFIDHLLVAGGCIWRQGSVNTVEVFNGECWLFARSLPKSYDCLKSIILNQHWYLMGGRVDWLIWNTMVHHISLESLIASCQSSDTETTQSSPSDIWETLTADLPHPASGAGVFHSRLVAVGGEEEEALTSSIHTYLFQTKTWIHIGDMPFRACQISPVVLPGTGELLVVGGYDGKHLKRVLKASIKVAPYDPDGFFTISALYKLEDIGVPIITSLNTTTNFQALQLTLSTYIQNTHTYTHPIALLKAWLFSHGKSTDLPPSWKNLFEIVRHLNLDDVAKWMETHLSGRIHQDNQYSDSGMSETEVETDSETESETENESEEESDRQIRLRDETIYNLKVRNFSLEDEIAEVKLRLEQVKETNALVTAENEHLRSQLSIKYETATWNLGRGIEVCGEMNVIVYSSHYQQIIWPGYGLRLNIPKGCLPAGMEQCTINIKASLAGQYEFPENSHLVSAIFWLRCEDVHKFTKPIAVEIQHCAKSENVANLKLSFVRALCSQEQLPYTFKQLPEGNFTSHSSYGVIELNSFSGVGVTQEGSENREYCSQLFYMYSHHEVPVNHEIHFVVTWNVETHLTVINNVYNEKGALGGPHQPVEFEADAIFLDIPLEGLSIKGWKITPLMRPVRGPCCQLKAQVVGRRKKIPLLSHQVKLKGAKYPNDVFVINLPARDTSLQERSPTFGDLSAIAADDAGPPPTKRSRLHSHCDDLAFSNSSASQMSFQTDSTCTSMADPSSTTIAEVSTRLDTKLDLDSDHFKVSQYLRSLDEDHISTLGGALGLSYTTLRKMTKYPDNMVAAWLRREDRVMNMSGEPTWRSLVEALRKIGQEGTARNIEGKES